MQGVVVRVDEHTGNPRRCVHPLQGVGVIIPDALVQRLPKRCENVTRRLNLKRFRQGRQSRFHLRDVVAVGVLKRSTEEQRVTGQFVGGLRAIGEGRELHPRHPLQHLEQRHYLLLPVFGRWCRRHWRHGKNGERSGEMQEKEH